MVLPVAEGLESCSLLPGLRYSGFFTSCRNRNGSYHDFSCLVSCWRIGYWLGESVNGKLLAISEAQGSRGKKARQKEGVGDPGTMYERDS